jgi:hypothetical protein
MSDLRTLAAQFQQRRRLHRSGIGAMQERPSWRAVLKCMVIIVALLSYALILLSR